MSEAYVYEQLDGNAGEILESINLAYGSLSDDQYGAYVITIKTSQRTLTIKGCHDISPSLSEPKC